jgi:hypothetical protein
MAAAVAVPEQFKGRHLEPVAAAVAVLAVPRSV